MKGKMKIKYVSDSHLGYVLFMGWIGALVFFVNHSNGFWGFILAVLKSAVWPAYAIHAVLGLLGVK